jgi:hypothetical protein
MQYHTLNVNVNILHNGPVMQDRFLPSSLGRSMVRYLNEQCIHPGFENIINYRQFHASDVNRLHQWGMVQHLRPTGRKQKHDMTQV